jgi:hypothetical protein
VVLTSLQPFSLGLARAPGDPVVDAAWDLVVDLGPPSTASSAAAIAATAVFATTGMPAPFCDIAQTGHDILYELFGCKSTLSHSPHARPSPSHAPLITSALPH